MTKKKKEERKQKIYEMWVMIDTKGVHKSYTATAATPAAYSNTKNKQCKQKIKRLRRQY